MTTFLSLHSTISTPDRDLGTSSYSLQVGICCENLLEVGALFQTNQPSIQFQFFKNMHESFCYFCFTDQSVAEQSVTFSA